MSDQHRENRQRRTAQRASRPRPPGTDPRVSQLENFVVEEIEISDVKTTGPQASPKRRRRWLPGFKRGLAVIGLALIPALAGLVTRTAWPTDETRWLAIAWEMWSHGQSLVPQLNGVVAAVPPLMSWLVELGWLVFGVSEWWPRLLPMLIMLASLLLAMRMARFLWPGQDDVTRYAPLVLLGGFYWTWSSTFLAADMLTVFFTLFALTTLLWMWRTRDLRVWLLLGAALGLGLLAAGSLIFLYVLPVALLAPLWTRGTPRMPWGYWYADIFKAVLMGLAIFAAWAVPAAVRTKAVALAPVLLAPLATHRLDAFPASAPWWWYLALLPVLAFPWSLWPLPWMRLWHIRREPISNGLLFCMVWAVPVIALLSVFDLKQPQFLLPLVPAFFLVAGWLLLDEDHTAHDHSRLASTMIFPLLALGGALAVLPGLPRVEYLPEFLWQLSPFVGVGIIVVGVAVGWLPIPALTTRISNMAATVVALTAFGLLAAGWELNPHYELSGAARVIASAQEKGQPVAHIGAYAGQFQFAGRLQKPLEVLAPADVPAWLMAHPDGLVVTYLDGWQPHAPPGTAPLYEQSYGETGLRLWPALVLRGG
jgi:4-amino-4-deoxy-L-arabinose transferase-like glycosyltransferase